GADSAHALSRASRGALPLRSPRRARDRARHRRLLLLLPRARRSVRVARSERRRLPLQRRRLEPPALPRVAQLRPPARAPLHQPRAAPYPPPRAARAPEAQLRHEARPLGLDGRLPPRDHAFARAAALRARPRGAEPRSAPAPLVA